MMTFKRVLLREGIVIKLSFGNKESKRNYFEWNLTPNNYQLLGGEEKGGNALYEKRRTKK